MNNVVDTKRPRGKPEKTDWKYLVKKNRKVKELKRVHAIDRSGQQVFTAANGLLLGKQGMRKQHACACVCVTLKISCKYERGGRYMLGQHVCRSPC